MTAPWTSESTLDLRTRQALISSSEPSNDPAELDRLRNLRAATLADILLAVPAGPSRVKALTALIRGLTVALTLLTTTAFASGLADHGTDLFPRESVEIKLTGFLRSRVEGLYNFDLDRGLTPSGKPLYAVPLSDPREQWLYQADVRARTDLAIYAPFGGVAVKLRTDILDDLTLGSTPFLTPGPAGAATPAGSPGQIPSQLFRVKRAYAEALTPVGMLSAGRMGAHWGMGMVAHGGDCIDCNAQDAADRIAFVTPIAGHLWAVAYDFSAVGPLAVRPNGQRGLVLDPSTDVRSLSLAVMNIRDDVAHRRRAKAGKTTFEYGLLYSHRWQDNDVPATYLPLNQPVQITPSQVMRRGFRASLFDGWARLTTESLRIEAEAAALIADVEQPSLVPGVLLRDHVTSTQFGGALEIAWAPVAWRVALGVNAGFASGDPAPGFGAYPQAGATGLSQPGEFEGPQAAVPRDTRVDNFRFHPEYRVDRIFFSEILGTVTDAIYARPWAEVNVLQFSSSALKLKLAATWSRAVYASSTPGNAADLGLELNPSLRWISRDGFDVLFDYAAFIPFGGLSNPTAGLNATPAQLLRLRLAWTF